MVTAVDPHLKEKKYKDSYILVRGFKSLKEIPKEKTRLLWQLRQRKVAKLVSHDTR